MRRCVSHMSFNHQVASCAVMSFMAVAVLTLGASAARADDGDDATPFVALLPFTVDDDVSQKEADGVSALFRQRFEDGNYAEVLDERRDDKKTAKKCAGHPSCLQRAAASRGVDLLVSGNLRTEGEGVSIEVYVSTPDSDTFALEIEEPMGVDEDELLLAIRRLVFRSVRPDLLVGRLLIDGGPEGTKVTLDGEEIGRMPFEEPVLVTEGKHFIIAKRQGYKTWRKRVMLHFEEDTEVRIALTRGEDGEAPELEKEEPSLLADSLAFAPYSLIVFGAIGVVAAVVSGGLAYWDRLQIENRANAGQLTYPRDAILFQRGAALGIASYVLAAGGLLLLAGGTTWAVVQFVVGGMSE